MYTHVPMEYNNLLQCFLFVDLQTISTFLEWQKMFGSWILNIKCMCIQVACTKHQLIHTHYSKSKFVYLCCMVKKLKSTTMHQINNEESLAITLTLLRMFVYRASHSFTHSATVRILHMCLSYCQQLCYHFATMRLLKPAVALKIILKMPA